MSKTKGGGSTRHGRDFSFPAPEEGSSEGAAPGLPSVRLGAGSKLRAPKL